MPRRERGYDCPTCGFHCAELIEITLHQAAHKPAVTTQTEACHVWYAVEAGETLGWGDDEEEMWQLRARFPTSEMVVRREWVRRRDSGQLRSRSITPSSMG
jgi:hypothetical protein